MLLANKYNYETIAEILFMLGGLALIFLKNFMYYWEISYPGYHGDSIVIQTSIIFFKCFYTLQKHQKLYKIHHTTITIYIITLILVVPKQKESYTGIDQLSLPINSLQPIQLDFERYTYIIYTHTYIYIHIYLTLYCNIKIIHTFTRTHNSYFSKE